jgi:hypothetical protein
MKYYIIGLMVSILFFTGCENIDFDFGNDKNDTVIIEPIPPIDSNETDDNSSIILDKREIIETIAKEWYVRIVVEDTTNDMKTAGAQLGQLDTTDVVTKHTLKAIVPFRPTYLDVVFVNPVGVDAGSYKSNFHASGTDADSWEFTIKSHDANANMILSWRGLYVVTPYVDGENRERYNEYRSLTNPLIPYMTLVDVTNNAEVEVMLNDTVNEYVFNMDGVTERIFKWKVKDTSLVTLPRVKTFSKVVTPILTQSQKLQKLQVKVLRKDAKAKPDALKKKRLQSFDMMTPPTFEVLVK